MGSGTVQLFGSPKSMTDITPAAGWVILDCDPNALDQTIRLVCMNEDEGACGHLFAHGGPQDKVVRLPESCGAGPFARIAHSSTADDQSIPTHVSPKIVRRDGATPQVISLRVDTNWLSIDTENRGETEYRIAGLNSELPAGYFHDKGLHSRDESTTWFQDTLVAVAKGAVKAGESLKDKPFFAWDANSIEASKPFSGTKNLLNKTSTCGALKGSLKVDVTAKGSVTGSIGFVATGKLKGETKPDEMATVYRLTLNAGATFSVVAHVAGHDNHTIHVLDLALTTFTIPGIATLGPKLLLDAVGEGELQLTSESTVGANFDIDVQYVIPDKYHKYVKEALSQSAVSKPKDTSFALSASTDVVATAKFTGRLIPKIQVGIDAFNHVANVYAQLDIWATMYLLAKGHASASVKGKTAREISDRAYVPPYAIAERDLDTTKSTAAGFTGMVIINAGVTATVGVAVNGTVADFFKALVGAEKDHKPLIQVGKAWQLLSKDFGVGHYGPELTKAQKHPIPETCPTQPGSAMQVVEALTILKEKTFHQ